MSRWKDVDIDEMKKFLGVLMFSGVVETLVVDESMIAFRGRLLFRQYNPSKSHKYGIKMYKLCTPEGFTWASSIYCGTGPTLGTLDKPGTVVVNLADSLLDEGRLIITDNFYTSVPLAEYLYSRKTDFCGTLRKNRKWLPVDVKDKKLKKGQGIDVSDQLSSYYNPQRKSLVWYKKVAMELLFGITVVNSMIIFNKQVNKKLTLLSFTESLSRSILCTEVTDKSESVNIQKNISMHFLEQFDRQNGKMQRKRCHGCYSSLREDGQLSAEEAGKKAKKVNTHCKVCGNAYCLICYNKIH
ncbi:piggyBac transposable element-derived protein 4-like [Melanaphis sacchari]|uniref:piggyBac transposable element-derived protein 4-like n=1 Tax=Melanaphis sacchari TaxID=742174 RepID=UPI000DC13310|nr:piggyBac transposable element-derived protein 4-like [Melanaphis sacchari]